MKFEWRFIFYIYVENNLRKHTTTLCERHEALSRKLGMLADRIIVTTDGDHTSVEVIVGLIHMYRRDMQCLNNSVMDTIIICPEAVIIGRCFEI